MTQTESGKLYLKVLTPFLIAIRPDGESSVSQLISERVSETG